MSTPMPDAATDFGAHPLAYVRVATRAMDASIRFAEDILGLERSPATPLEAPFRTDERARSLIFVAEPAEAGVAIEMADGSGMRHIAERLAAAGHACREASAAEAATRGVARAMFACDPSGNRIELVTRPQLSGRRFYASRDSGVAGLTSVGLRSCDIARDVAFWTDVIGGRIGDHVGDIAYLRFDGAHHRVALYPSDRNGLLYVGIAVRSHDDLMRNSYFLQENQIRILHGPGLETASGRAFVRFAGPDGQIFAFDFDETPAGPWPRPRQFALEPVSLCAWGSACRDIPELSTERSAA